MKIRVAVVFGGRSGEHEVSLASATSIMDNMDRSKYEVIPVGITKEGRWLLDGEPMKALKGADGETGGHGDRAKELGAGTTDGERGVEPAVVSMAASLTSNSELRTQNSEPTRHPLAVDVVFPVLHGPFGEDGTIQGLLEMAGVPYVGAGVLASAAGMDKAVMKALFLQAGLPVVKHILVSRKEWEAAGDAVLDRIGTSIGYPCFVKPANLGSSVGISKAVDRATLAEAMRTAASYDRKLIVEEGIDAREIECSVLGNDDPIASLPGEVVPCNEFYDYRAKYVDEGSQLHIPAPLPRETTEEVRRLAVEAFKAVDCAGMARVDFFVERRSGRVLVNEINTIPGFTKISMYPKLWEASGLPYPQLIDKLIDLALERHAEKMRNQISYDGAG
ncbi:MAG: D-alanine--D-alanine ligase [Bacteroidetes bacterium]|nr:D-alanine--D-alanine ligase [Bacteroidota bacterium]